MSFKPWEVRLNPTSENSEKLSILDEWTGPFTLSDFQLIVSEFQPVLNEFALGEMLPLRNPSSKWGMRDPANHSIKTHLAWTDTHLAWF